MSKLSNHSIKIQRCEAKDIALLDKFFPFPGDPKLHQNRFQAQQDSISTYLIAWADEEPVGHLNIRWQGCKDEAVKRFTEGCPEFSAIGVREGFQSQGIGTKLIQSAEEIAKDEGYKHVGLGVGIDNSRAKQLYERLGYKDWGQGIYEDVWDKETEDGKVTVREKAIFLVKDI